MTKPSSPPRCQVEVEAPARVRAFLLGPETVSRASYICGEPLVRASEGPCETCGLPEARHGNRSGNLTDDEMLTIDAAMQRNGLRALDSSHHYISPRACPVHGAVTGRGGDA